MLITFAVFIRVYSTFPPSYPHFYVNLNKLLNFAKTSYITTKGAFVLVKGVSKTIIEVNNTGSKLFEKIVFYVTPEYGNLNAKQLKRAAANFSFNYGSTVNVPTLRKRIKRKKIIKAVIISGCGLLTFLGVCLLVL